MAEMKTLNGYEIVDAKARQDIANIQILTVPTKVSELENDAGYLTQHQDISGKADKVHKHTLSDVTDYVAPDLSPYATKQEVKAAVDAIEIPEVDLTGYATKTFVNEAVAGIHIPSKVSELENDKGYLTQHQDLSSYALKTEIPSIEGLATETFVTESINNIPGVDLSNYYNKTETDNAIATAVGNINIPDVSNFANKVHTHSISDITDYVAPDLSGYALKTDIPDTSSFITSIPAEYVTETELENKGYLTAVPAEYVTETELDQKGYLTEHQSLADYATKTYVDNAIANIPTGGSDVTEVFYFSDTTNGIDFINAVQANPNICVYVKIEDGFTVGETNRYVPAVFQNVTMAGQYLLTTLPIGTSSEYTRYTINYSSSSGSVGTVTKETGTYNYYTNRTEVQNMIDTSLGVIENGTY